MEKLTRTNSKALVANDYAEYKAAKLRNKNVNMVENLTKRVAQLEECVLELSNKLRKLEQNDN